MDGADAEQLDHALWRPPTAITSRTIATTLTGAASESAPDTVVQALAALDSEIAALRGRLTTAEPALGLPAPRYGPAPPDLPALLRRVGELERRSGVVPGLAPLAGLGTVATPVVVADAPAGRAGRAGRAVWRGLAGAAVAVFLIALALLPFPGGGTRRTSNPAAVACHAAGATGVPDDGCTYAVTPTPAARPALRQVATAAPTAGNVGFQQEKMVPSAFFPSGLWTAPCRAGSSECIPDEDYPPPVTHDNSPPDGDYPPPVTHGNGPADEYGAP